MMEYNTTTRQWRGFGLSLVYCVYEMMCLYRRRVYLCTRVLYFVMVRLIYISEFMSVMVLTDLARVLRIHEGLCISSGTWHGCTCVECTCIQVRIVTCEVASFARSSHTCGKTRVDTLVSAVALQGVDDARWHDLSSFILYHLSPSLITSQGMTLNLITILHMY